MSGRDNMLRAALVNALQGISDDDVRVILGGAAGGHAPIPEPSDLKYMGNVSSLPTIASGTGSGGTEAKFNVDGIIIPCPGAIGAFWARPLQVRWASVQPGRPILYHQELGIVFAQDSSIQASGQLILEFYPKPPNESMHSYYDRVKRWTSQSSEAGAGSIISTMAGAFPGSAPDVTLGTFTQTGGTPTQLYLAGSNMPVGGATKAGALVVSTSPGNTDMVFVGETSALAIASNNPLGASGQDTWNIPVGGKAFFLSNSGTQTVSARFRSAP